ncbi:hypothetical protein MMC14_000678 [Varicellaria rhodocarpa]|nr:hypothetical protein [Varicellaria rhodocarpa]
MTQLEYECPAPNLHWFDLDRIPGPSDAHELVKVLDFSSKTCVEDVLRQTWAYFKPKNRDAVGMTINYLRNFIEEEGPFQGVIGLSEGAGAAATVLIDHLEICRARGSPSIIQCGIFLVGFHALKIDSTGWLLSDETDQRITVPTCHILSYQDPLIAFAEALWNLCDHDTLRTRVLHDRGHVVPHESEIMVRVAKFVRDLKLRVS